MNTNLIDQYKHNLIQTAIKAKSNSYCIVSHFSVGAAVLTQSGRIFQGVNVENRILPCGWCAEVSAVGAAVSNGHRDLVACAVSTNAEDFVAPCGQCRQVLAEFSPKDDLVIFLIDRQGKVEQMTLNQLLPKQFGEKVLPDLYRDNNNNS